MEFELSLLQCTLIPMFSYFSWFLNDYRYIYNNIVLRQCQSKFATQVDEALDKALKIIAIFTLRKSNYYERPIRSVY